jgi:putative DNA primase/helicase
MKYDFDALRDNLHADILGNVQTWLPDGKVEAHEYVATNPTRGDNKKGSFKVNLRNGKWADFATDEKGGDLISLYAYLKGLSQGDAYKELSTGDITAIETNKRDQKVKKRRSPPDEIFTPMPVPTGKPMTAPRGKPERTAIYKDENGIATCRICIYRFPSGKTTVPLSYGRRVWPKMNKNGDGSEEWSGEMHDRTMWHQKMWPDKRPLYNLDMIATLVNKPLIIGEGEKVAQTLQDIFGDEFICTTWIGGSKAVKKADWSTVHDRHVILCPDYDLPGQTAMLDIATILKKQKCRVTMVWEPLDEERHPAGWDLADVEKPDEVRKYINGAIPLATVEALIAEAKRMDAEQGGMARAHEGLADRLPMEVLKNQYDLRCLGYGRDNKAYFINRLRGIVVALAPDALGNINHLLSLAPLDFWYDLFPNKKGGLDKHACSDCLQRWADDIGYFSPDIIRGSGVWREDNGDVIMHMGQKLLVNDRVLPINEYKSQYMYEATSDLGVKHVKPLDTKEAKKLLDICKWLSWECPVYANLLAGFCVVAPICGGLEWRPHIWVTGSSGSGKSTVMKRIVKRMCGKMSLFVLGDSTAAGIRQRLGSDALPVIFDEFEGESAQRLQELQKTIDLARQSSSESGALMLKGSIGGDAMEFKIRSCFAFSAINVNVTHFADKTRISVLTLQDPPVNLETEEKNARYDKYQKFTEHLDATLTSEYVNAMQMRAFAMLPVILQNAEMFGKAVSNKLNSRRLGDQLGILCAGSFALESPELIDEDVAAKWVEAQDWTLAGSIDEAADHKRCLSYILQAPVRIQNERTTVESSIGELIEQVCAATTIDKKPYEDVLKRYGVKIDPRKKVIYIANMHTQLERILKNTPYNSWSRLLTRLEGAKPSPNVVRFGGSTVVRATQIPIDTVIQSAGESGTEGTPAF